MANQFLALSLFIVLLAFFIVLNVNSNYTEAKFEPVKRSLEVAFSSGVTEPRIAAKSSVEAVQEIEESYKEGSTLEKIEALFNAEVAGVEIQKNRLGTEMYIRMPLREFEKNLTIIDAAMSGQEGIAFSGTGVNFLPMFISLLQASDTEIAYHVDMIVNTTEEPAVLQNDEPAQALSFIQKAGRLGQIIGNAGLETKYFSSGLALGEEGMITLHFKRYKPFIPVEQTEEAGGEA